MKILVVDDTPSAVRLLVDTLSPEGYEIITAGDGSAALEIAQRELPDLILLDVMLPGMSGFDVCRQLRTMPVLADTSVMMVTALDDRASRIRAFEVGADDFLTKPFDRLELKLRLRTASRLNRFRRLADQQREYGDLARLSPDGILSLDASGAILAGNPAARALVGSLADRTLDSLFHMEDRPAVRDAWARVMNGRAATERLSARVANGGGEFTDTEVTLGRAAILSGRQRGSAILHDISDRRALESQLYELQRSEIIADSCAEVAHDVSNSLLATQIQLHRAGLLVGEGHPAHEALNDAGDFVEKAGELLRALARFERQEPPARDAAIVTNLNAELREAEPMLRVLAGHADLRLQPCEGALHVSLQPAEIHQVVSNLVANARDAVEPGGTIVIRTSLAAPGSGDVASGDTAWSCLEVTDNGHGMSDDVVRQVFDQYFTTKNNRGGTGLGLPSVHRIVTRHHGTIEIESRVGHGSTFRLAFPPATRLIGTVGHPRP